MAHEFNENKNDDDEECRSALPFPLSQSQKDVIQKIKTAFESDKQFLGLLHGAPGSGKSTVVRELKYALGSRTNTLNILQTATTGVAATELEHGITINSLFGWRENIAYPKLPEKTSPIAQLRLKNH